MQLVLGKKTELNSIEEGDELLGSFEDENTAGVIGSCGGGGSWH